MRSSHGLAYDVARDVYPTWLPFKLINQRSRHVPVLCAGLPNSQVNQMVPRAFYLGLRGYLSVDRICGRGGNRAGLPVSANFTTPVASVQAFARPPTAVLASAQSRGLDSCAAAWGSVLGQSRPRSRWSSS